MRRAKRLPLAELSLFQHLSTFSLIKWPAMTKKGPKESSMAETHLATISEYLAGFLKSWLLKIWPISPERSLNYRFYDSNQPQNHMKEKGEGKRLVTSIIVILPTLEKPPQLTSILVKNPGRYALLEINWLFLVSAILNSS